MPTFELKDFPAFTRWLERGMADGVRRGLASTAFRTLGVIVNELIPAEAPQPVDRGFYRAGWHVETTPEGADLVNSVPYAVIIEKGARGENIKIGRKMIDELTQWVVRKGLVGRAKGARAKQEALVEARNIAWGIAVSMKKKGIFNREGTKGLRIGEKAMKKAQDFIHEEVMREIKRQVKG